MSSCSVSKIFSLVCEERQNRGFSAREGRLWVAIGDWPTRVSSLLHGTCLSYALVCKRAGTFSMSADVVIPYEANS
jgi:hypothetical protein